MKSFGNTATPVLDDINLEVAAGELLCVIGASGCGKSTLLNLIAGLDRPSAGRISVDGGHAALMFQESALFPWLTAAGNVELALRLREAPVPKAERREEARRLLSLVRLDGAADKRVHELSGGMRQRVAMARALAQNSAVLLMDEPFAALDAITRDVLHEELISLWDGNARAGRPLAIVFVTHNVREAVRLGQRVMLLSSRPGRVAREWTVGLPQPRRIEDAAVAGLDALETARAPRAEPLRRLLRVLLPPVLAAAALLGLWNLLVLARIKPGWVLPGPGDVYDALRGDWTRYGIGDALWGSISRAVVGFAASVLLGTLIGLAAAGSRTLRSAVAPLLSGLQNLPSVAWVPIAIMWFGITPATIYTVMLLGAVPSVTIGLIDGIDQVPPIYRRVGGNLGARGLVLVRRVLLPAALPAYVSGLKQGWAFSWRSLMAAELIAVSPTLGPGIGQTLELARENQDMALAFATVLLILGLGVLVNVLGFAPVERGLRHRRGLERA